MEEPIYLKHLEDAVPEEVHGYTVSSYCVALEGWRRGLTLKFINQNRRKSELVYSLSNGEKEHVFSVARGDLVPRDAIKICMDKNKTKNALLKAGVPTPVGKVFNRTTETEDYVNYANRLGYPLVVKPVNGTGGSGVITGIESEEELLNSINYVQKDLSYEKIIIEKYFEGDDYRLYVLDGKVIGAFTRDRANVIGDGKSTIKELVNKKNELRASNPALKGKSKINLNQEAKVLLKQKGYDFNTIPVKGEKVYLNTKNNVSSGGDPTDATDFLNDEMKKIAVDAASAIPGLVQGGVDMIIDSEQKNGNVLEINSRPHIRAHIFPMKGKARDIPKEIIDYYFPETKTTKVQNVLYFDFGLMYKSFYKGYCSEFVVPDHPIGNIELVRYELKNLPNKKEFGEKCKKNSKQLGLHGYVKKLKNGTVSLVLTGIEKHIEKFEQRVLEEIEEQVNIEKKSRKKPLKIGFEVINMKDHKDGTLKMNKNNHDPSIDGYFPVKLNIDTKNNKKSKSKNKSTKKKSKGHKVNYKEEYEKVINSTSWKVTKPLRAFRKMLKK